MEDEAKSAGCPVEQVPSSALNALLAARERNAMLADALRGLLSVAEADLLQTPNPHPHRVAVIEHARDALGILRG